MNAVEQIVELYFQNVRKCFTCPDIKVKGGNNRQIDLLAYSLKDKKSYHVESSVTHVEKWNPKKSDIEKHIKYKFLGYARKNSNKSSKTDFNRKKSYRDKIEETYAEYGIFGDEIIRVWVLWCSDNIKRLEYWKTSLCKRINLDPSKLEILSFRDEIIPKLQEIIGTSNYEHDIKRTLSLIYQYSLQKNVTTSTKRKETKLKR